MFPSLAGILFGHYWRLLRESGSPWLILHAVAPFALVLVSGHYSYGFWQKSMILYLVVLANVRHHLLGRDRQPTPSVRQGRRAKTMYRLQLGRTWARRKAG